MAQFALVWRLPCIHRTLKIRQVLFGHSHRFRLIVDQNIDHTVWHLKRHRTHFLWRVNTEAATLDHCWTAHGNGRVLGRDNHITTGEQCGIASKAAAVVYTDHRHRARELRKLSERMGIKRHRRASGIITRAPTTALAEKHDWHTKPQG